MGRSQPALPGPPATSREISTRLELAKLGSRLRAAHNNLAFTLLPSIYRGERIHCCRRRLGGCLLRAANCTGKHFIEIVGDWMGPQTSDRIKSLTDIITMASRGDRIDCAYPLNCKAQWAPG